MHVVEPRDDRVGAPGDDLSSGGDRVRKQRDRDHVRVSHGSELALSGTAVRVELGPHRVEHAADGRVRDHRRDHRADRAGGGRRERSERDKEGEGHIFKNVTDSS